MRITGLENLTLQDLKEIFKLDKMSVKNALPILREFANKHSLTHKQSKDAFSIAKRIFGEAK